MSPKLNAKRSLGQNFLVDPEIVAELITHVKPTGGDTIVEIGPGHGAITGELLKHAAAVIAIEIDRDLAPQLRREYRDAGNLLVIETDALSIDFRGLLPGDGRRLRLVANLPYNISTAILQRLIDFRDCFSDLTLMFQLEVVERIMAPAGSSSRGFLTVMVEAFFDCEKLLDVPPRAFRPVPKVQSAVVRLIPKLETPLDLAKFRSIVSMSFAQKRKTILNNLANNFENSRDFLAKARIDPMRRAETLTILEWQDLVAEFMVAEPRN